MAPGVQLGDDATSPRDGSNVPSQPERISYSQDEMETNDFVQKLLDETSLEGIDWASDVERILAEQVVFLREQLREVRQETVLGTHGMIGELYCRLEDKQEQIQCLKEEVGFLRQQLS